MMPATNKKPDQADMLAALAKAVNLDNASPEAQAAHDRLKASLWTKEDRARGRKIGQDACALKAKDLRRLWKVEAVRLIVDNYDAGQYIFRAGLLRGLHSFNVIHGYKGKCGMNIQLATISRWFTQEVEAEIRLDAIAALKERQR